MAERRVLTHTAGRSTLASMDAFDAARTVLRTPQAEFHPWATGTFDARPGLHKLLADSEPRHFLLDDRLERFLANKREVRLSGALHHHYLSAALHPALRRAAQETIAATLEREWPQVFAWESSTRVFFNRLLGWTARLEPSGEVAILRRESAPLAHLAQIEPVDALDFLAVNVPEDLAIWRRDPASGAEWLALLHVCAPEHWDPRAKIGRPFAEVHQPVADIAPTSAASPRLARAAIEQGPFLRFAWGVARDEEPNRHPDVIPPGLRSRPLLPEQLFLRVERQTLLGLPEADAAIFTIRPYWYRLADVARSAERRRQLAAALRSMSDAALRYKGLTGLRDPLVAWLERE